MTHAGATAARPATVGQWLAAHTDLDRLDREVLLARAADLTRAQLIARPETPLDAAVAVQLDGWAGRRRQGEPLAYIVGVREFHGLELEVSPEVLVPRPETELLVALGLERLAADRPARALDLGTGSGAIAIALAVARPNIAVVGTDCSEAALAVAARNAARHGVSVDWLISHWLDRVDGRFDLIVGNPPYVAEGDPHLAALVHEPRAALVAGADGLDALRAISRDAPLHLTNGGTLALEHGWDQGPAVRALLTAAGLVDVTTHRDLAGHERVTVGHRSHRP